MKTLAILTICAASFLFAPVAAYADEAPTPEPSVTDAPADPPANDPLIAVPMPERLHAEAPALDYPNTIFGALYLQDYEPLTCTGDSFYLVWFRYEMADPWVLTSVDYIDTSSGTYDQCPEYVDPPETTDPPVETCDTGETDDIDALPIHPDSKFGKRGIYAPAKRGL